MSNRLEELHYQYKRYYLKMILKSVGVLVIVLSLVGVAYILMQEAVIEQVVIEKVEKVKEIEVETVTVHLPPVKEKVDRQAYALDVSVDELEASVQKIKSKSSIKKVFKKAPTKVVPKKTEVKKKQVQEPLVQEEVQSSFFSEAQEEKSLDAWIDKYNKKRSYSTAIFIAKQYYFDEDYKQAGIWSKRANQLNRNKEEAWLFYAKSVYALGNIPKAKRILNIYLQYKQSAKAKLLLSEWNE